MSYFDSCENCSKPFKERQYTFAWCDPCLETIICKGCGEFMTKQDHTDSMYYDECMSCFGLEQLEELEKIKVRELERKAIELKSEKYRKLNDEDLESAWQSSASSISMYAMASWKDGISKEESKRLHNLAEESQNEQGIIQDEITRRH